MSQSASKDDLPLFKIAVLGSGASGKSTITIMFVQGIFVEEYDPTIEDTFKKVVNIDGEKYVFGILDQAGCYDANTDAYLRECSGILLVYGVTSRSSFEEVPYICDYVRRVRKSDEIPVVLCGNMIDLADERKVKREEGQKLADDNGWLFIETSAKTGENVEEAFYTVFHTYRPNDNDEAEESSKKCIIC